VQQSIRVKQTHYLPQFPFFKMVSDVIERLVEESREEANKEIDLLKGIERNTVEVSLTYYGATNQQSLLVKLKEIVVKKIKEIMQVGIYSVLPWSVIVPSC